MNQTPLRVLGLVGVILAGVFALVLVRRALPTPIPPVPEVPKVAEIDRSYATNTTNTTYVPVPTPTPPLVPAPQPGILCDSDSGSICVSDSFPNRLLTNPFTVTGTANVFESQFLWELRDANQTLLESGYAMASGQPGPFEIRTFFSSMPKTASGTLVLFDPSAKDGTPQDILTIPVRFPTKSMAVTYFSGGTVSEMLDICLQMKKKSVLVPRSNLPMEAALRTALKEDRMELISFVLSKGVATVDALGFETGLMACQQDHIVDTLKQFPQVTSVIIKQ